MTVVDRLRLAARSEVTVTAELLREAADEIERLRDQIDAVGTLAVTATRQRIRAQRERDDARAELSRQAEAEPC
jgi:hypothetical protein